MGSFINLIWISLIYSKFSLWCNDQTHKSLSMLNKVLYVIPTLCILVKLTLMSQKRLV